MDEFLGSIASTTTKNNEVNNKKYSMLVNKDQMEEKQKYKNILFTLAH